MALTELQRAVCRVIAANRIELGESYIAGAVALNQLIGAPRISQDVDLFHDTAEAVDAAWAADRVLLERAGFAVHLLREQRSFVEAEVSREGEVVVLQWVRDSAYRFFPLVEHDELGLTLHPFDLATNKVLALVGRLEVRDWIDVIECDRRLQPLGHLAWAACGKDPGFNPSSILQHAARSTRYSQAEVDQLSFAGESPDAGTLAREWHGILDRARRTVGALPASDAGKCVLTTEGQLHRGSPDDVARAVRKGTLVFHTGSIRGALPQIAPR